MTMEFNLTEQDKINIKGAYEVLYRLVAEMRMNGRTAFNYYDDTDYLDCADVLEELYNRYKE